MKKVIPFYFFILVPIFIFSNTNNLPVSDPGTMNLTPISACGNQEITADYGYNAVLDPGDIVQFILHDEINILGNVFSINSQPVFSYVNGMNYGTFYFISAIAGMDDGTGNVDLTDPDLAISDGTPIEFFPPQLITVEGEICDGGIFEYEGYEYTTPGFYTLEGTDSTGCLVNVEITVNEAEPLDLQVLSQWNIIDCNNWGVNIYTNLNGADYVYEWRELGWQGNNTVVSTSSVGIFWYAGQFDVRVTDINTGCTAADTFYVFEDTSVPTPDIQVSGTLNCSNAVVTIEDMNSGFNYYYEWEDADGNYIGSTSSIDVTEAGTYYVIVTDWNNGCETWESVDVVEDVTGITVTTPDEQFLHCFNDFSVALVAESSTITNAEFTWTGPNGTSPNAFISNSLNPIVTIPGTYFLTSVNILSGCIDLDTIEVIETSLLPAINLTEPNCGLSDGAIGAYVPDIDDPSILSYTWSTGETTDSIENLAAGEYFVTVSGNNCVQTRTVNLTETPVCRVKIRGTVFLDHDNQDCMEDATTQRQESRMICLYSGATGEKIYTYTDANGDYEFIVDPGNYLVRLVKRYNFIKLCPTGYWQSLSLPTPGEVSENNDFYDRMRIGQDFAVSAANTNVRPLFNNWFTISYCNNSDNLGTGTVSFTHDPSLENLVTSIGSEYDSYDPSTQTITWDFINLQSLECQKLKFKLFVPNTVAVGDVLSNEVNVGPLATDYDPSDNQFIWSKAATLSFDPNDKQEFSGESNFGGALYNPEDSTLHYQIQFQNTGSDTAFNVVLKDVIDENLDVTTIRTGVSSHDYELKFEGSNTLIFEFRNIQLPHEAIDTLGSQGFVTFSIKQKPDLPLGTEVRNKAAIYFDFNAPIITNEVVNVLEAEFLSIEGKIITEDNDEIVDVNVLLSGDANETSMTDASGRFLFEDLGIGGNYEVSFEKNINPLNGVTTQDIYKIYQHMLGLELIDSPYKIWAGDVNNSGSLTSLDAIQIRNLILLNTTEFPNSNSWKFIDANFPFSDPTQPGSGPIQDTYSYQNMIDNQNANVIGVKVGDVNGNANANNLLASETRNKVGDILFVVDNQEVRVGEEIVVSFTAKDFQEITSYQYTFEFDMDQLIYTGFEKGMIEDMTEENLGFNFLEDGQITMAWATFTTQDIKDGETLFYLKFKAQENGNLSEMMQINSRKIESLAYDKAENIYDVKLMFGGEDNSPEIESGFQIKVTPTVTKNQIKLQFTLEQNEDVSVLLFNSYGSMIHDFDFGKRQKGNCSEELSLEDFPPGVYYVFVKTKQGSALERIVKM